MKSIGWFSVFLIAGAARAFADPAGALPCAADAEFDDGAARAAACAPQRPELLAGYRMRPRWRVAGVDYCVGVPSDVALKDPEDMAIEGVQIDRDQRVVLVTAPDVTLDGYDFSLHGGYGVRAVGAPHLKILHSRFIVGPTQRVIPIQTDPASPEPEIAFNIIDGGGLAAGADAGGPESIWSLMQFQGDGATVEYNWLKNSSQHIVELSEGRLIYRFNLIESIGFYPGAHPNGTQFNGGVHDGSRILFNTFYEPQPKDGFPLGLGEAIQVEAQLGSTITNTEVGNNVIVTTGPAKTASYAIAFHEVPGPNRNDCGHVHHNYIDSVGAWGPFYRHGPKGGAASRVTYTGNIDLRSGMDIAGVR